MKNTLLKIGGLAVAIGGAYLYMKNKGKKEQEQALASIPATTQPVVTTATATDTGTYTKDEAKKLAMSVVEKTIKLYDEIPKDRLADKHRSVIQEEEFKAKQDEYKKVKALAKSKNQKSFTYLGETYNTLDGKSINSGSSGWFYNPYEGGIAQATISFGGKFFTPRTLGDQANKFKKAQGWVEQYDFLVNAFTKMPKSQVDALLPILPKMYFTAQPYAYLQEYLEKNPYSMQETLLFREANLDQYSPKRDAILGTQIKALQSVAVESIK